jgi:hypothetical protein
VISFAGGAKTAQPPHDPFQDRRELRKIDCIVNSTGGTLSQARSNARHILALRGSPADMSRVVFEIPPAAVG